MNTVSLQQFSFNSIILFILREEGTEEAYFLFREFFFLLKYIQMCTKSSPKPALLVQY